MVRWLCASLCSASLNDKGARNEERWRRSAVLTHRENELLLVTEKHGITLMKESERVMCLITSTPFYHLWRCQERDAGGEGEGVEEEELRDEDEEEGGDEGEEEEEEEGETDGKDTW